MGVFTKESLERLRQKIDLVEILSAHLKLKPSGSRYSALCPFHEEKSPSFVVQRGDSHYHCFGCGAHGDAIAFLMSHLSMTFQEAVESLADRFNVPLEEVDSSEVKKGPNKKLLKEILSKAADFYHFYLLHTEEGHQALKYLYARGIDLDFIRLFKIGYAPKRGEVLLAVLQESRFLQKDILEAGLLNQKRLPFFSERVMFPVKDPMGAIIGFSGRKIREETFGGKYINSPETPLFKKSQILYGMSECRKEIAKNKRVIIVEGQIDALRLIQMGFNWTVAGQGTAFGEEHLQALLQLGVTSVYLALDADKAGREAARKIGDLFQRRGVDVYVAKLPEGADPDTLLKEQGPESFAEYLKKSSDYLTFLIGELSREQDMSSPSQKNRIVQTIASQIREWDHPLMVHESLRRLAQMTQVPEQLIGVGEQPQRANLLIKKQGTLSHIEIDPDRILEVDLLRWLLLQGQNDTRLLEIARFNLTPSHFRTAICRRLFSLLLEKFDSDMSCDLISLAINLDDPEEKLLLSEIVQKRINQERAQEGVIAATEKLLQRHWMHAREEIKVKIQSHNGTEDEVLELAKAFDDLKSHPPQIQLPEGDACDT